MFKIIPGREISLDISLECRAQTAGWSAWLITLLVGHAAVPALPSS